MERKGEYFRKELQVNNTSAQYPAVAVEASDGVNTGGPISGHLFVPPATESYTHDADGNLAQDGRWDYTWDAENRLVKLESRSNAPGGSARRIEFGYDWRGRRVWRKVTNLGDNSVEERKYIYDGWNLYAEFDGNGALAQSYVWGPDLSGDAPSRQQRAGGVGGLVGVKPAGAAIHFVACDGNGNVAGLVDGSTGEISAWYEYGPFGEPIRVSGAMAKLNPFRFSTKYTDEESGFLYYGYRYYNPETGRWLNRDPIEEGDGPNIYQFVKNRPMQAIDLFGLGTWKIVEAEIEPADGRKGTKAEAFLDPSGFHVTYRPSPGECPNGEIIIFQIISCTGLRGEFAHVDTGKAKKPECPVPPAMEPAIKGPNGDVPYSYEDSPGDRNQIGIWTFRLTAVAVCRDKCKDKLLSRKYFTFDNEKRKLSFPSDNPDHYKDGLKDWSNL